MFDIVVAEETVFSDEYPAGTIAKQEPAPDTNKKGELPIPIKVWISVGKDVGQMIDVTETLTLAQARVQLKSLKDKYDLVLDDPDAVSEVFHDEIEAGYVVSTIPAAGEPLEKGDTVQFVISKGKEIKPVTVRNYVGLQLTKARELVAEQGLVCTDFDVTAEYSDRPGGEVFWQSIPANTEALEGDTIQFKVSSGLAPSSIHLEIPLPQDRDQVEVVVYVGDETTPQYSEKLNCADEVAYVALTGNGTQYVKVYFVGLLNQAESGYRQFG